MNRLSKECPQDIDEPVRWGASTAKSCALRALSVVEPAPCGETSAAVLVWALTATGVSASARIGRTRPLRVSPWDERVGVFGTGPCPSLARVPLGLRAQEIPGGGFPPPLGTGVQLRRGFPDRGIWRSALPTCSNWRALHAKEKRKKKEMLPGLVFKKSSSTQHFQIRWVSAIADFLLAGMVVGPLAAPFLAASGLSMLPVIANIIYFMGVHVCPQPDMGVALSPPYIMAVCMRCYGTVTGLLTTRLLYAFTGGKGFYWLSQYGWSGAALASVLMMAYPLELAAEVLGWWSFNNYVITPFGLMTGLAWGLFTMPILHEWRGTSASEKFET